jgi:hypothetical protein
MVSGDTVQMPPASGFFPAGIYLGFWVRPNGFNSPSNSVWYSFEDRSVPNQVYNTDGHSRHTAWVYLEDYSATLFGFEDASLGDADYNDVMFTFTIRGNVSLNDIPIYSGGLLQTCRTGLISAIDYVESACYQWALLQPPSAAQCNGFIEVPSGWQIAPKDSITDSVVKARGTTWSQSVPNGCLIVNEGTTSSPKAYAYSLTGAACSADSGSNTLVKFGTNDRCWSTTCANKILLRSITELAACDAIQDTCSNTPPIRTLYTSPSSYVAIPVWPTEYNVYMQKGTAQTLTIPYSVTVPATPSIDVMILFDVNGGYTTDIRNLANYVSAFAVELTKSPQNFDIPNVGFATYTSRSSGSYVTINCALQLAESASSCINGVPIPSGTQTGTLNINQAVIDLMNSPNSAIGWRTTAYRFILVITDNNVQTSNNADLTAAILEKNIIPVFYLPNSPAANRDNYNRYLSGSTAERLPLTAVRLGTLYTTASNSQLGQNRLNGWAISTATNLFRPTYNKITFVTTGSSTQNSFIQSIPAQLDISTNSPISKIYNRDVVLRYSTSPPANMPTTYPVSLKVLGFSSPNGERVNIITNNPPIAPSVQFTATQNTRRSFNVPASDPDGNQVTITFSCPIQAKFGYLFNPATNSPVVCGEPVNNLALEYVPDEFFFGTATFDYTANDGCDNSPVGTVTFDVARVNIPPVANDFTVYILESELDVARQTFTFIGNISDRDDDISTLRIRIDNPPTGSLGRLAYPDGTVVTTSNNMFPSSTKTARFIPTQYQFGSVAIPYSVLDPSNAVSSAVVTVVVVPVNNAPTLTAPSNVIGKFGTNTRFTVTVTEQDPGDFVRVVVVPTVDFQGHEVRNVETPTASAKGTISTQYDIVPVKQVTTAKPYTYTVELEWVPAFEPASVTFTLRAYDDEGAFSEDQVVTLALAETVAPVITTNGFTAPIPKTAGADTNNAYTGSEETPVVIKVSGSDEDAIDSGPEWQALTLVLNTLPTFGTLRYRLAGTTNYAVAKVNTVYDNTIIETTFDAASQSSVFELQYTGSLNWHGSDSFRYYIRDSRAAASPTDTVTLVINNVNDPPTSGNVELYMDAGQTAPFTNIPVSDPDSDDTHYLVVTRLPGYPDDLDTIRGNLLLPDIDDFVDVGVKYQQADGWNFRFRPIPYDCSAWTEPLPPYAIFSFQVCDNHDLCSANYTGTAYVRCVNNPPTSDNFIVRTPQDTNLTITIPAADRDAPDVDAVLTFQVTSFASQNRGKFYYNNLPLEEVGVYVKVPRSASEGGRKIVYVPELGSYSTPLAAPVPLATFLFQVVDSKGATSKTHTCNVIVDFVNHPPVYLGATTVSTDENVPLNMFLLYPDIYSDDGLVLNGTVTGSITKFPARGTFQVCRQSGDNSICDTVSTTASHAITSPRPLDLNVYGRVVFTPDLNEWSPDERYAQFALLLEDSMGASSTWTFTINVREINQAPTLIPQFVRPPSVFEDEFLELQWRVEDVDSLPGTFTTVITTPSLQSLSRFGWSSWNCNNQGTSNETACVPVNRETDVIIGNRENGFTAPVASLIVKDSSCVAEPGYPFTDFSNCYAIFKVIFAADPDRYGYQYTQWTWTARDGEGALSVPLSNIISVLPVNDPPVITAPESISPAAGLDTPSFADGNVIVSVADPDSLAVSIEQLNIEVVEGNGELTVPSLARCSQLNISSEWPYKTWQCSDTIRGFNRWLPETTFRMASADGTTRVVLQLTLNDLGAVGVNNLPHLTDSKNITLLYTPLPLVVVPGDSNNYLTVAVGVAAAAGVILLAAIALFLRKKFAAPNDDYFQVAVAPLSLAPQNPLYKAQFKEHFSPLYNPDAAQ